jgi:hypothetical protein
MVGYHTRFGIERVSFVCGLPFCWRAVTICEYAVATYLEMIRYKNVIDATVRKLIASKIVERAVERIACVRLFIRIEKRVGLGYQLVTVGCLVYIEIACQNNGIFTAHLRYFSQDEIGALTASLDANVV